jgi:hypothetical protein
VPASTEPRGNTPIRITSTAARFGLDETFFGLLLS